MYIDNSIFSVDYQSRIVVVGVGTSGSHIIEHMKKSKSNQVTLLTVNDKCDLQTIQNTIKNSDIVIITLGLGSKTGLLLAPIIAKMAKDTEAYTLGVVTKPFTYEGIEPVKTAEKVLNILSNSMHLVITIPDNKLLAIIDPTAEIKKNFQAIDALVSRIILDIIAFTHPFIDDPMMGITLTDFKELYSGKGVAIIEWGEGIGDKAAYAAFSNAISSLNNETALRDASVVFVHFKMHPPYDYFKFTESADLIYPSVSESTDIIFNMTMDENLPDNYVLANIIVV